MFWIILHSFLLNFTNSFKDSIYYLYNLYHLLMQSHSGCLYENPNKHSTDLRLTCYKHSAEKSATHYSTLHSDETSPQ